MVIVFQVKNTQELPTLKSLISYKNQINDDKNHIENIYNQFKINNNDSNADNNIQNGKNDKNTDFEEENSEILKVDESFQGIKIPVRIIDDQNVEINHQFAVLQFPKNIFNSTLRGNVFKIEIIGQQKDEKNFKNQFNIKIDDKLFVDVNNNNNNDNDHDNNQEASLRERKIREEDVKIRNSLNEFISTSIKPTTLRRSDIIIPKSQNSLRGFFITKDLEEITEAITEDVTESDRGIEIDLSLGIVTTESEFNLKNNWIDKINGFLQSTPSIVNDNFSSADSTTVTNNNETSKNAEDDEKKILVKKNSPLINDNDDDAEKNLMNVNLSLNNTKAEEKNLTKTTTFINNAEEAGEKNSSALEESISPKNKWRKWIIRKIPRMQESEEDDQIIAESELEVNQLRNSGASLRKPGNFVRPDGSDRSKTTLRNPIIGGSKSDRRNISKIKIETFDQSSRAQELAVSLADPPNDSSTKSSKGKSSRIRESQRHTIDTRLKDVTDVPTVFKTTTAVIRRRQRPRNNNKSKIIEVTSARPRQPAVIDYDYYLDEEVRLSLQRELKDKLYVTREGGVRCLDQGNFAHPASCKKFINCARVVNGQMIATEYTCPDRLSFDPIGGICNWSAGLGCKKSPFA